jgi:ABC-type protease/lipase transport system fused ATPase/permease subunit
VETVTFIVLYLLAIWLLKKWVCFSYEYLSVLCGIAVLTNIATHKKMKTFVAGVIARDIADDHVP